MSRHRPATSPRSVAPSVYPSTIEMFGTDVTAWLTDLGVPAPDTPWFSKAVEPRSHAMNTHALRITCDVGTGAQRLVVVPIHAGSEPSIIELDGHPTDEPAAVGSFAVARGGARPPVTFADVKRVRHHHMDGAGDADGVVRVSPQTRPRVGRASRAPEVPWFGGDPAFPDAVLCDPSRVYIAATGQWYRDSLQALADADPFGGFHDSQLFHVLSSSDLLELVRDTPPPPRKPATGRATPAPAPTPGGARPQRHPRGPRCSRQTPVGTPPPNRQSRAS